MQASARVLHMLVFDVRARVEECEHASASARVRAHL